MTSHQSVRLDSMALFAPQTTIWSAVAILEDNAAAARTLENMGNDAKQNPTSTQAIIYGRVVGKRTSYSYADAAGLLAKIRSIENTATPTACNAAINTSELLENILLHLPPQNILRVQRVTRRFRDTVRESKQIQSLLFPQPETAPALWYIHLKFEFISIKKPLHFYDKAPYIASRSPVQPNPLLLRPTLPTSIADGMLEPGCLVVVDMKSLHTRSTCLGMPLLMNMPNVKNIWISGTGSGGNFMNWKVTASTEKSLDFTHVVYVTRVQGFDLSMDITVSFGRELIFVSKSFQDSVESHGVYLPPPILRFKTRKTLPRILGMLSPIDVTRLLAASKQFRTILRPEDVDRQLHIESKIHRQMILVDMSGNEHEVVARVEEATLGQGSAMQDLKELVRLGNSAYERYHLKELRVYNEGMLQSVDRSRRLRDNAADGYTELQVAGDLAKYRYESSCSKMLPIIPTSWSAKYEAMDTWEEKVWNDFSLLALDRDDRSVRMGHLAACLRGAGATGKLKVPGCVVTQDEWEDIQKRPSLTQEIIRGELQTVSRQTANR